MDVVKNSSAFFGKKFHAKYGANALRKLQSLNEAQWADVLERYDEIGAIMATAKWLATSGNLDLQLLFVSYKVLKMNCPEYFYDMANLVAKKSKDQSTQIGAVIVVPDNEIRSIIYNSFPSGINDDLQERQERPEKYYWIEHAERNALYNANPK